jgi:peptidoglycan/LPS O-acetylase OafA/YrhL
MQAITRFFSDCLQPIFTLDLHIWSMKARVPALDLLRLVAVLGVVLFHYGFRGPTTPEATFVALPEMGQIARYGFLGVPMFFVISGFVIAYSAEGRSAADFAIARFARIYPTFVFCMTVTFLAVVTLGAPSFLTSFGQWAANLVIAAPHSHYMDSAYWSLVVEVIFYGWVALFIWTGLFEKRSDVIIGAWLAISVLNEVTIDATWICKFLLADYSGFFATGILLFQLHKGRRDPLFQCLLAFAIATAVFQSVHNLHWIRAETGAEFEDLTVGALCFLSILAIMIATRVRTLPLPGGVVVAIGGMTYPLYLLHQQLGYVVFRQVGGNAYLLVAVILVAIAAMSWATWRFVERPAQQFTKQSLISLASRLGLSGRTIKAARVLRS